MITFFTYKVADNLSILVMRDEHLHSKTYFYA